MDWTRYRHSDNFTCASMYPRPSPSVQTSSFTVQEQMRALGIKSKQANLSAQRAIEIVVSGNCIFFIC